MTTWIDWWLLVYAGIAAGALGFFVQMSRKYNRDGTERKIKYEVLQSLTSSTLGALGVAIPAVGGVLAFVQARYGGITANGLMASLGLFVLVAMVVLWVAFALLGKVDETGLVALKIPADRAVITSLGIAFGWMVLAFLFVVSFFLIELPASSALANTQPASPHRLIRRPHIGVGLSKRDVIDEWGAPSQIDTQGVLRYEAENSTVELTFDPSDILATMRETKR